MYIVRFVYKCNVSMLYTFPAVLLTLASHFYPLKQFINSNNFNDFTWMNFHRIARARSRFGKILNGVQTIYPLNRSSVCSSHFISLCIVHKPFKSTEFRECVHSIKDAQNKHKIENNWNDYDFDESFHDGNKKNVNVMFHVENMELGRCAVNVALNAIMPENSHNKIKNRAKEFKPFGWTRNWFAENLVGL